MTVAVLAACVVSVADGAADLRLLVRHLAVPSARRGDPQRGRYRLDAQPDGRADDAARGAHGARRHAAGRVQARLPAGLDAAGGGAGRRGPLRRHRAGRPRRMPTPTTTTRWATSLHHADTVLLPQMTIKEAVAMFENAESDALAVVDGAGDAARDRAADRAIRAAALQRGTGPAAAGVVRGVAPASRPVSAFSP